MKTVTDYQKEVNTMDGQYSNSSTSTLSPCPSFSFPHNDSKTIPAGVAVAPPASFSSGKEKVLGAIAAMKRHYQDQVETAERLGWLYELAEKELPNVVSVPVLGEVS